MKVSFIIPIYNEANHLKEFFKLLSEVTATLPYESEYVVIDDASSDKSWSIIQEFAANQPKEKIITFQQPVNKGKGAALHKGIALATGDVITIQDADFEYDPYDIASLLKPIADERADVVFGSRFHKSNPQVHRTFHYLVNRFLTILSNIFSGLYLTDMETCYKVFKSEIIKPLALESERFGFEPEVTANIAKLKVRVHEYPISYFPRSYLEGKKISWKDGIAAVWFILKYNLRDLTPETKARMPAQWVPKSRQWL